MPSRSARPCSHPGCTTLVALGSRCPAHARDLDVQRDPARQRMYDRRWRKIRKAHLAQHPWCENGIRQGVYVPATDVHHLERHVGDAEKFYTSPLESLCHQCHSAWTAYEAGWTDTPPHQKCYA